MRALLCTLKPGEEILKDDFRNNGIKNGLTDSVTANAIANGYMEIVK
jgi:hypothetical protein